MPLDIRPGNPFLLPTKSRWLQWAVVLGLAAGWWWSDPLAQRPMAEAPAPDAAAALAAAPAAPTAATGLVNEAALGLSTIEVMVGRNDTLDRIFRKLELSVADLASLRELPGLRAQTLIIYNFTVVGVGTGRFWIGRIRENPRMNGY